MILIRTAEHMARAMDSPLDPDLIHCLRAHWQRISEWADYELADIALFAIIQRHDALDALDTLFGGKLFADDDFANPVELIARHGGWIEVTFILSDDGFGLVLLIEDHLDTDPQLLSACHHALAGE